ncbi:MAG: transporter substrate-binding protein [Paenibacillaceae bacterium]|jgi:putative aldouronate transport system substrate-binding protein|nr:transporter substrate-binding protein [Paenibacillaceae bacterium]
MSMKKILTLTAVGAIAVSVASGCGGTKEETSATLQPAGSTSPAGTPAGQVVDIEVWATNLGFKPITKESKLYQLYKEKFGVGIIQPYVEWNGGTNYLNQLNLKIAANEMPDLFLPQQGIEWSLAKNGAIADLTDLLPTQAPNLWNAIPKEVWDVVKANDPTGKGRIYYIPGILDYGRTGAMIRKDWLDKLNLPVPKTQEEYVKVLEAFRDKDPNGNGQKDEIPTGGREQAVWMDHLFAMYGIAMNEGKPDWDIYDGKLTYSAVTPNMRDSLQFIAKLYKDGLLDKETLLNNKAKWDGKIEGNRVGNYFHWVEASYTLMEKITKNSGTQAEYVTLPVPEVPGYKGFYTVKKTLNPVWVVKNNKGEKLDATLKFLNQLYDKSRWNDPLFLGAEGMHYTIKDGKTELLPSDKSTQENPFLQPFNDIATLDFMITRMKSVASQDRMWAIESAISSMKENQKYVKTIAGDGMPASVYEGYADINNRILYVEYASKIILGQYPIEKFDEFVDKWYKSGGEEVTKRAREWYEKVKS